MIIVIDGYNLLKQLFPRVKGKLNKQRDQLIRQLGFYKRERPKIKEIVLVFDGGLIGRATREVRGGVTVIFVGRKRSADDWIVDYVERHRDREIVLVTRDRELISLCRKHNVEVLKGEDFYNFMQDRLLEQVAEDLDKKGAGGKIKKYRCEAGEIESEALDMLMEQYADDAYKKDDQINDLFDKKKGSSRKLSKEEKKRLSKLKKL